MVNFSFAFSQISPHPIFPPDIFYIFFNNRYTQAKKHVEKVSIVENNLYKSLEK